MFDVLNNSLLESLPQSRWRQSGRGSRSTIPPVSCGYTRTKGTRHVRSPRSFTTTFMQDWVLSFRGPKLVSLLSVPPGLRWKRREQVPILQNEILSFQDVCGSSITELWHRSLLVTHSKSHIKSQTSVSRTQTKLQNDTLKSVQWIGKSSKSSSYTTVNVKVGISMGPVINFWAIYNPRSQHRGAGLRGRGCLWTEVSMWLKTWESTQGRGWAEA